MELRATLEIASCTGGKTRAELGQPRLAACELRFVGQTKWKDHFENLDAKSLEGDRIRVTGATDAIEFDWANANGISTRQVFARESSVSAAESSGASVGLKESTGQYVEHLSKYVAALDNAKNWSVEDRRANALAFVRENQEVTTERLARIQDDLVRAPLILKLDALYKLTRAHGRVRKTETDLRVGSVWSTGLTRRNR
jgi:hypothetical protein